MIEQQQANHVLLPSQGVATQPPEGDSKVARPLALLWGGGLVAASALALIVYIASRTWLTGDLERGTAYPALGALSVVYAGAVFAYSYGHERYDLRKALRSTAMIVGLTFAFVVILVVVFVLIAASSSKKSGSSTSSHTSEEDSHSPAETAPTATTVGRFAQPSDHATYYGRRDNLAEALLFGSRGTSEPTPGASVAGVCASCQHPYEDPGGRFCANCGAPRAA